MITVICILLIINDISIFKIIPICSLVLTFYAINQQKCPNFEVKIHYIWHQICNFLQKQTHFLLFSRISMFLPYTTRIYLKKYHSCTPTASATTTLTTCPHKLIGILFPIISHYFSLFPIISHYFPLFPISPKRCRIFASENKDPSHPPLQGR